MDALTDALTYAFPRLLGCAFRVTSLADADYNCIAWAAGDTAEWWEPDVDRDYYWPPGIRREYTLEAYKGAYQTIGYKVCASPEREKGWEKVAIFTNAMGTPKHAARQLPTGQWTSKCGEWVDIEHSVLDAVSGNDYGQVACVMKRPVKRIHLD